MKLTSLIIAACLLITINGFTQNDLDIIKIDTATLLLKHQPKFFINVHSGYAIGLGSTFKFYPDDITSVVVKQVNNQTPTTNTLYKSTTKGLGDGFRYGAGLSYILNDFVNLGFEFDYFKSIINRTRDSSFYGNNRISDYIYNNHFTISYEAMLLTLSPTITFKAISRPKFYIYNKLGAVLTFRPNSIQKNIQQQTFHSVTNGNATDSSSYTYMRYSWGIKKPALGFMGSVGGQFRLSENVRAFAEIQFSHIVFAVNNRVLTDYMVNNKNLISSLPESEKLIDFRNSFSTTQSVSNPNEPSISVVQRIPITYLGVEGGFAYRF